MTLSAANYYSIEYAKSNLAGRKLSVLTGAGMSTDSGIPDYRGEGRVIKHPMTFDLFVGSPAAQARYWARSYVGWRRISDAQPNPAHIALAEAQSSGRVSTVTTQNVDGLHQQAGTKDVLELHGTLSRVVCMSCGEMISRQQMDGLLHRLNPSVVQDLGVEISPDGDAEIEVSDHFRVPVCSCGGFYKPDVVFFGESVPVDRVKTAERSVTESEGLLVAGSSLTVNSGLRLVKLALRLQKPVVIVNLGATRADGLVMAKINASLAEALPLLLND